MEQETRDINLTGATLKAMMGIWAAPVAAGVSVNEATALGLSALWCGLRTISQDVGTLPAVLYSESGDGTRTPARTHPVYTLLRDDPNDYQTRPVFWESFMFNALLHGNAYAEVERDEGGLPIALHLVHPSRVKADGRAYLVANDQGPETPVAAFDLLHLPGLSPDGSTGYQLLEVARESLGFSIAAQQHGAAFFGNAARPSGALTTPGVLGDDAYENLRKSWSQAYQGSNTGRVAILENGVTFTPIFSTNEQSQYVELLQFAVYEVARLLNIPPSKLYDLAKATWGNLTELNRDYLQTTLRPWLVKLECELERKLLTKDERAGLYVEHDVSQLLKADTATRYQTYSVGIAAGFLDVDEVRAEENLPPRPAPEPEPEPVEPEPEVTPPDVASLVTITEKVAAGTMTPAAAVTLLRLAFPDANPAMLSQLVQDATPVEPEPEPDQEQPGEQPADDQGGAVPSEQVATPTEGEPNGNTVNAV